MEVQQSLFPEPSPAIAPVADPDPWGTVDTRLYGTGWKCAACIPIPTLWLSAEARDIHRKTVHQSD